MALVKGMRRGVAAKIVGEPTARMQITLTVVEKERLTQLACSEHISLAELLRRAVTSAYLKQEN